jgi:hypothetical protein
MHCNIVQYYDFESIITLPVSEPSCAPGAVQKLSDCHVATTFGGVALKLTDPQEGLLGQRVRIRDAVSCSQDYNDQTAAKADVPD